MYGAIIGDIIGSRYEFKNKPSKDFELFTDQCRFTDDTVMTVAVANAVMASDPEAGEKEIKDSLVYAMQGFGSMYPKAGYGGGFRKWLRSEDPKPYGSWGNGSAMRVSAVGWIYPTLERVLEVAGWTAEVTHNHPDGVKGAQCTAAVIFLARAGRGKSAIREYVNNVFGYDTDTTVEEFRNKEARDISCAETLPRALAAFFEGNSYEDAVRNAASIGGDTDTIAAIAGSMAEAYYGIPDELIEKCNEYLPKELKMVVDHFTKINAQINDLDLNPEYRRNMGIEYLAEEIIKTSDTEKLQNLYQYLISELFERREDDGQAPTPCVDANQAMSQMDFTDMKAGDTFTLDQEMRLRIDTMTNSAGEIYIPLFTTEEQIEKGEAANIVINWPIDLLLKDAAFREDVSGLVINPFSTSIV